MKRIAHRTDKWDYSGGDVGNIWVDIKGKKYHHIVNILKTYSKKDKIFIIDYEKGEIFLEDETYKHKDVRDESNHLGFDDGGEG